MLTSIALALATGSASVPSTVEDPPLRRATYTVSAYAAWSRDGSRLVYQSDAAGNYDLYVMAAPVGRPTRITDNPAADITPVFSPDGKSIVFVSERDGNREVYRCDLDGKNQKNLSNTPGNDIHPMFNADGSKIMFSSNRGNSDPEDFDIYEMNADGTNVVRITRGPEVDTYASRSPDGKKIVTRRVIEGNNEVFLLDADGSNPVNLSNSPGYDGWPVWSPDGSRIMYAGGQPGREVLLYLIKPDGTDRQTFISAPGTENRHPWFSPSGKFVSFTRYRPGEYESTDILVAPVKLTGA